MEPVPSIAKSIVLFVDQARKSATPELSQNVEKLSNNQIALALKVIKNTNNMWSTYQEGADPKLERDLGNIVMILSGATEGNEKSEFSLQSFLQTKEQRVELREKQIRSLVNTIIKTDLHLKQTYVIEEKSTSEFIKELEGEALVTDDQLTNQLFRDYSGLIEHIKIDGKTVEMKSPSEKPASWKDMIPPELTAFIGEDPTIDPRSLPLLLNQGVAADPWIRGMELIHDPLMPEAQFNNVNSYPYLEFSKSNEGLILLVKSKGFLGITIREEDGSAKETRAIRYFDMTQVINLSNPEALVKMTIAPRDFKV